LFPARPPREKKIKRSRKKKTHGGLQNGRGRREESRRDPRSPLIDDAKKEASASFHKWATSATGGWNSRPRCPHRRPEVSAMKDGEGWCPSGPPPRFPSKKLSRSAGVKGPGSRRKQLLSRGKRETAAKSRLGFSQKKNCPRRKGVAPPAPAHDEITPRNFPIWGTPSPLLSICSVSSFI